MTDQTVYVVDDDDAVRDALLTLIGSLGLCGKGYASADAFLDDVAPDGVSCLITDVWMPGTDGMTLQRVLHERQIDIPLIAISAHGDIPMAVEMVRRGAVDFIEKPFRNGDIIARVREALARSAQSVAASKHSEETLSRLATLTPREKQVLGELLDGASNKVVARRLDLSPRTVETHRAHILHKMHVDSVTALLILLKQHRISPDTP